MLLATMLLETVVAPTHEHDSRKTLTGGYLRLGIFHRTTSPLGKISGQSSLNREGCVPLMHSGHRK